MTEPVKPNKFPPGPHLLQYICMYVQEGFDFLLLAKRLIKTYGDMVHVQMGSRHHYYINHPDDIEKILIAGYTIKVSRPRPLSYPLGKGLIMTEGEKHKEMRRRTAPSFQKNSITDKAEMIVRLTDRLCQRWKEGEVCDVVYEMNDLVLGIIVRVLFGPQLNDETTITKLGDAINVLFKYGHQNPISHLNLWLIKDVPAIGRHTRAGRALQLVNDVIYGQINDRRAKGDMEGSDFLAGLLRMQADNPQISDRQIRDELFTLFFAGHETTAISLSWTLYLLSQNPDAEAKLHEEVDRILDGRLPAMEDVPNFSYLRQVIMESMRVYPAVWTVARSPASEGIQVGEYYIPRKSMILLSTYITQHDERFFPNPERFIPERFTVEEQAKRPKYCYFPFAGGNRKCIGEHLFWLEAVLILSTITSRWRLQLVPGHPIQLESMISLKPKYGIQMSLRSRQQKVEDETASFGSRQRVLDGFKSPGGVLSLIFFHFQFMFCSLSFC